MFVVSLQDELRSALVAHKVSSFVVYFKNYSRSISQLFLHSVFFASGA